VRIIQRGEITQLIYTGTCTKCRTVFEAEKDEVKNVPGEYNTIDHVINCPVCGFRVYVKPEHREATS